MLRIRTREDKLKRLNECLKERKKERQINKKWLEIEQEIRKRKKKIKN